MDQTRASERRNDDGRTLELREEELRARRQTVESGEVELRKEVHQEQRVIDVPVTHEEVVIERRPVDRRPDDRPIGDDQEVRVPVHEEQVTIEKRPLVTEEVAIGKRAVRDTERVTETLRREEAVVDHDDDVPVRHRQANVPHADHA